MALRPVDDHLDLPALEERILARWKEHDIFDRSLREREGEPEWVFYEGPPTANGRPGIHHVWARCFKDLYPRFQTMRGHYVARKGGWDCHGLPVEVEIEKELGLSSKAEIEEYGIEEFNRRCRDSVQRYVEDWGALTSRIGMWLDTADAYWTLTNDYIESVWWQLKQIWDGGLLYEDYKVVPYCARCGTALSSHEVGQPGAYREVTDASVYVRFPVRDADFDLLVWTTTPWTLISNVAAAVGPSVRYVRVRVPEGRDVVMGADRVEAVYGDDAQIVDQVNADDLVGLRYERPFDFLELPDDANRIVSADFVTTEDGTGIVHLAPAFGEVDRDVCEAEGLPTVNPVDRDGLFSDRVPPYAGRFVKDADPLITDDLRDAARLEKVEDYTHSYPHCWRCDRPLIYYAKPSWFIRTTERSPDLLAQNETIGWHPDHIKHGRFGNWLENNVDWALSRDRFWGTPLPVWRCGDGHDTCIGSVDDLAELTGTDQSDLDLHRPYVDDVTFACPEEGCDGTARRLEPVLDAWFDSGAMPAAQYHHPFAADGPFDRRFPADFICEAIDQTRGWFYSLLAVNTLVFGSTPYKNVVCLAHVVDKDGQKMSKSRANVVDPWEVLGTRGADALRWYFFSSGSPWTNRRIDFERIDESVRTFLLTLWNTYKFHVTYANLDGWTPGDTPASDHVLDRWMTSRAMSTVRDVTSALEGFDALRGAQALEQLVDDLSNWYVRLSRSRFWNTSGAGVDGAAHATLHHALLTVSRLLAPFCPFFADDLYGNLAGERGRDSVHLDDWPATDESRIDADLESEMEVARTLVQLGRAARSDAKVKVRQPISRALIVLPGGAELPDAVRDLVAAELNVKQLEVVTSLEGLIRYAVVPNFRELGPRLGPKMPRVKQALEGADGAEVQAALDADGHYEVTVDGEAVRLASSDVEIRAQEHEEFALAQEGAYAVALDLHIGDDLRLEGLAREIVRALNDHRKAIGLDLADRIEVRAAADGDLKTALDRHGDWIAAEVLAETWTVDGDVGDEGTDAAELDIEGTPLRVSVRKR